MYKMFLPLPSRSLPDHATDWHIDHVDITIIKSQSCKSPRSKSPRYGRVLGFIFGSMMLFYGQ